MAGEILSILEVLLAAAFAIAAIIGIFVLASYVFHQLVVQFQLGWLRGFAATALLLLALSVLVFLVHAVTPYLEAIYRQLAS